MRVIPLVKCRPILCPTWHTDLSFRVSQKLDTLTLTLTFIFMLSSYSLLPHDTSEMPDLIGRREMLNTFTYSGNPYMLTAFIKLIKTKLQQAEQHVIVNRKLSSNRLHQDYLSDVKTSGYSWVFGPRLLLNKVNNLRRVGRVWTGGGNSCQWQPVSTLIYSCDLLQPVALTTPPWTNYSQLHVHISPVNL